MVSRSNLKVVESVPFQRRELQLWSDESSEEVHSLHDAVSIPGSFRPELPAYFIGKYSAKGGVVLDPFCGSGTTALEANLTGRIAFASDVDPLSVRVAEAKVTPADITEVTLRLQLANLRRPIAISAFGESFRPFFDLDTFRELVNLRSFLNQQDDRVSRFVSLVAMGLLHGHTAGYFSVSTFPQVSLLPADQVTLNLKRGQSPDYRALVPRILRKTAGLLRDGFPTSVRSVATKNRYSVCDARNLAYVPSSAVDLVVTAPPLPQASSSPADQWLREWFLGFSASQRSSQADSLEEWRDFMNETLLELARVSKPGARIVLDLREVKEGRESHALDEIVMDDVHENLGRYLEPEGLLLHTPIGAKVRHKERDADKAARTSRILVLRRR